MTLLTYNRYNSDMTNTAVKQKPHKDSVDVRFAKVETTIRLHQADD
ncbi:hypothetical protein DJ66_0409 [Candidatus Liberibacter solanacearum]|uniref:Uncharacterized protein n=1 Tax=Candidatus Liberibacter solanacearum TaxID=556287 RepID=A0A0F4VLX6_9HYPH|nr:hypothetical protein DJ66_0409 [Candidatus Liberibacter solanacearum]